MIEVTDLHFGYVRPDEIYRSFSWSADPGEAWVVLGPSGCGKTTLVYLLAGLRRASSGVVRVDGTEVGAPRTSTGLILQDHGLLPWAKAKENVALGLRLRGVPSKDRDAKVRYWLERLGIASVADKYPGQLSGGQRQRVAIARTLALDPSLLLMDEPFSALDSSTREDLQELVVQLSEGSGMATVLVTHDIQEAVFMGRHIMVVGQPPIQDYVVIDNPEARQPGYRQSPEYFARCAEVRRAVERTANSEQRTAASEERGARSEENLPLPLRDLAVASSVVPRPDEGGRSEGHPGDRRDVGAPQGTGDDRLKPRPPREEREAGDEPPALQVPGGEGLPQHPTPNTQHPTQSSVPSPQSLDKHR